MKRFFKARAHDRAKFVPFAKGKRLRLFLLPCPRRFGLRSDKPSGAGRNRGGVLVRLVQDFVPFVFRDDTGRAFAFGFVHGGFAYGAKQNERF